MKRSLTLVLTLILFFSFGVSSVTLAAGGRYDHSSVYVWSFLALCALIVLAQMLPALGRVIRRALELESGTKVELGTSASHRRPA